MDIENSVLNALKSQIKSFLNIKGVDQVVVDFERTSDQKFGDFSTNVAMKYSKILKSNPTELAKEIVSYLQSKKLESIQKVEFISPGFINLFIDHAFFKNYLLEIIKEGPNFGKNQILKDQRWVVEHTSPNPNKAMHLGHLRNNLVGMGIVRILKWNGAEVISDAVYNDRGIAIAKLMYGFLVHMKKNNSALSEISYWLSNKNSWYTPEEKGIKPDAFVTECYVLGEQDFKKDVDSEKETRDLVVKWENNDLMVWELWKHVLGYAYQGINDTLNRLGNHWDKIWYEHEHYQKGKDLISRGLKEGAFQTLEDGAVLTDLKKYNIPDTILLKKDGTSLYITQDLALTFLKKNEYNADKLVWIIGPEQSLAMKQLFAVCEQLGIGKVEDFTHVPYGYVGLKDEEGGFKKMSSRDGTVVLIDDVIDIIKNKIKNGFSEEKNIEKAKLDELSERLAVGAIKFSILRSDKTQNLTFDINQSIDVHGDSGVYVMYSYVRTQSILRKVKKEIPENIKFPNIFGEEEALLRSLLYFPETIKRSQEELSVHYIAQYLLELSSNFNSWYAKEVILDGSETEDYKIAITKAVGIIIKNGLGILGIKTVEEI
ncbi:MAG: arginine--tRNA ligase [Candidatus Shapirobacteria bacterium]